MDTQMTMPMTKEMVAARTNIALTKVSLGLQQLSDLERSLEYNEDNLGKIADFLKKSREAKRIIESEHKLIKEPVLRQSQVIDESRRNMTALVDGIMCNAESKYASLCAEIEDRRRKAEADRVRKQNILLGIDANMVHFSAAIAGCKTNKEIIEVERVINLEKSYRSKYAEFYDVATEKYSSLTESLSKQKEYIKELEKLEKQREKAESSGDADKVMEILDRQTEVSGKIDEGRVTIQETAINHALGSVEVAVEDIPKVKARRTSWTWEVANIKETAKKMPDWVQMQTIDSKIDEFMKASRQIWDEDGKEEIIQNGIRFFVKRTY